jgi:hypothetical protein
MNDDRGSRPFIDPPKRAPAKRIGFTLAGIALLAAGLIVSERWNTGVASRAVSYDDANPIHYAQTSGSYGGGHGGR